MLCTSCQQPVRPVVALDIDGTTGQYHRHFFFFAREWLGESHGSVMRWCQYDGSIRLAEWMGLDSHVYRQIKLAYRQGGMKRSMPVMSGSVELVQSLHALGAEVWFTTTRPYLRHDNIDPDTRAWLDRNGFKYEGLIYDDDKYGRLLELVGPDRVVGVLEDLVGPYKRAEELGLNPIQRLTNFNRAVRQQVSVSSLTAAGLTLGHRINQWKEQHATVTA